MLFFIALEFDLEEQEVPIENFQFGQPSLKEDINNNTENKEKEFEEQEKKEDGQDEIFEILFLIFLVLVLLSFLMKLSLIKITSFTKNCSKKIFSKVFNNLKNSLMPHTEKNSEINQITESFSTNKNFSRITKHEEDQKKTTQTDNSTLITQNTIESKITFDCLVLDDNGMPASPEEINNKIAEKRTKENKKAFFGTSL